MIAIASENKVEQLELFPIIRMKISTLLLLEALDPDILTEGQKAILRKYKKQLARS